MREKNIPGIIETTEQTTSRKPMLKRLTTGNMAFTLIFAEALFFGVHCNGCTNHFEIYIQSIFREYIFQKNV